MMRMCLKMSVEVHLWTYLDIKQPLSLSLFGCVFVCLEVLLLEDEKTEHKLFTFPQNWCLSACAPELNPVCLHPGNSPSNPETGAVFLSDVSAQQSLFSGVETDRFNICTPAVACSVCCTSSLLI